MFNIIYWKLKKSVCEAYETAVLLLKYILLNWTWTKNEYEKRLKL